MNKSFSDILDISFSALRKSFLSILGLYVGTILFVFLGGVVSALFFGRKLAGLLPMLQSGHLNSNTISAFIPQLIIIAGIIFIFILAFYFIGIWQILIVRNNILMGKGFLKQSFFETLKKAPKLIFFWILAMVVFLLVFGILIFLLKKISIIFIIPSIIFLGPISFVVYYGILCKEGKLWDIVVDSFDLGYHNWGRVFGYSLLFGVCIFVCLFVIGIISYFLMRANMALYQIFRAILQFIIQIFSICFFTAFYLDLAGIVRNEKQTIKVIPEIVIEDQEIINGPVAEQKVEPNNEDKSDPKMEQLK